MPTISEIVARASLFTGLTNSGAEQTLMIAFANEIYAQALQESEYFMTTAVSPFPAGHVSSIFQMGETLLGPLAAYVTDYTGYDLIRVEHVSYSDWVRISEGLDVTGPPQYWTHVQSGPSLGQILVWPVPDEDFTLEIITPAVELTTLAGADTPTRIPAHLHHRVISNGVIAMCLDREGREERANAYWDRYRAGVLELTDMANKRQGSEVLRHFRDEPMGRLANDVDVR